MAGACGYGNELSSSIKCWKFLDKLQNQLASQEGLCSMEEVSKYIFCVQLIFTIKPHFKAHLL